MELKLETGFVGSASDMRFGDLIVEAPVAVDPPIAPLLLALVCASPPALVALLLCFSF
ncbi:hypothetical protein [Sphingomonas sp. URHD0057]|uniref:hypothetical protein n=1 Tax=Sphingomonas sp. URHD0057 TaxID=1380389 RepID=UPI000AB608D4|nr:hypothetical protein [Sphingomonas sp. URHD0057]